MGITISADDPRSIKSIEIAAAASQWLKCRGADGSKRYGVPSQTAAGRYYLVDLTSCTCPRRAAAPQPAVQTPACRPSPLRAG